MSPMFPNDSQHHVFLPIVTGEASPFGAFLGIQVDGDLGGNTQFVLPHRIYQSPLKWQDIEVQPHVYTPTPWLMANVDAFKAKGAGVILGTKTCPAFYREWDRPGSPPRPEHYQDYAAFMQTMIDIYMPTAVELFNEPDVPWDNGFDPELEVQTYAVQEWYGAWVVDNDFYAAGLRYGQMTAAVTPMLRGRRVKVVAGAVTGSSDSLTFLQGAIAGGLCADYISFHNYIWSVDKFPQIVEFARSVQQMTNIPLICTEANLLAKTIYPNFRHNQAEFIRYLRSLQGESKVLEAIIIYNLYGTWNHAEIVPVGDSVEPWAAWSE